MQNAPKPNPWADKNHPGNKIRPEVRCLGCGTSGCTTAWGDWCYDCNVQRIERINRAFRGVASGRLGVGG